MSIVTVGVSFYTNFDSSEQAKDSSNSLVPLMYCRRCLVAVSYDLEGAARNWERFKMQYAGSGLGQVTKYI
jgi:hypothetical protein